MRSPRPWLLCTVTAAALTAALPVLASMAPAEPRFPASLSDLAMRELLRVGRVAPPATPVDAGNRWGQAPADSQERSMLTVLDALAGTRPPLSVAASILAIARVESGWNPWSENPTSTACGLFQFVKATWANYAATRESCFDPRTNAEAGVKHLTSIWDARVRREIGPIVRITTETERLAYTYRLLYAYHYHGEASPLAPEGGSLQAQAAAEAHAPALVRFYDILKKATAPPPKPRVRTVRRPAAKKRQPPPRGWKRRA